MIKNANSCPYLPRVSGHYRRAIDYQQSDAKSLCCLWIIGICFALLGNIHCDRLAQEMCIHSAFHNSLRSRFDRHQRAMQQVIMGKLQLILRPFLESVFDNK